MNPETISVKTSMSELGQLPAPVEVARVYRPDELRITYAYTAAQMEAERKRCYLIGLRCREGDAHDCESDES